MSQSAEITNLLKAWKGGDQQALEQLAEHVYPELRLIARRYLKNERPDHSLQPTALVNEVYLRLVDVSHVEWKERAQFFAMAAQMMRRILVDAARTRNASKRGGLAPKVRIEDLLSEPVAADRVVLAVDDALDAFARVAPRQAKAVELRYFGGLTEEELVEVLGVSLRTVRRDWVFAKAWLAHEMNRT